MKRWWKNHRPSTRRLVQLYAALLYNAHLKGFVKGEIYRGKAKVLCVPGLNCYSCPGAVGACPLGALQNAVADSAHRPAFYAVGVLLLFGLILGRTVCGWLCPFGLIQELLHRLPMKKLKKSRGTRALSWIKYLLLALLVLAIPLWSAFREAPLPGFCKYVCPAGTLEGAVALLLHPANGSLRVLMGGLFSWKLLILLLILGSCVFVYRAFCRFFCPLGAIYGIMTRLALVGVKLDRGRCVDCGRCQAVCLMDIRRVGDRECIACGKCVRACPEGAITFRAGKIVLMGEEKTSPACRGGGPAARPVEGSVPTADRFRKLRPLGRTLAVLFLAAVLVYFNLPNKDSPASSQPATENLVYGSAVGQILPDFTVQTSDGVTFLLSEQRGKVVVLNLWATWCAPCVKELPLFADFAAAHPDAAVLAIHGKMVTEDVETWLKAHDFSLSFAMDEDGSLSEMLGASGVLPHTVVLDRNGVVIYNAPGAVSASLLKTLYIQAD